MIRPIKPAAFIFVFGLLFGQAHPSIHQLQAEEYAKKPVPPGDMQKVRLGLEVLLADSIHLIRGKSIALVTNQTGKDHDGRPNYELLMEQSDVRLKVIFSPEHGLFGTAAAGEKVEKQEHRNTLPPVISLYGKVRKPTPEMLEGVDVILYDIQDIGARFYTYISTLGLVMEAAGEQGLPVLVLDRPNPLTGIHVDGPVLKQGFESFVGAYPIPVQYGLTVGELATLMVAQQMISPVPELKVVPMQNWDRSRWLDETDSPWTAPSPNMPDLETAALYPGLCLFEGTNVSEGRGTDHPFKWIGAPWINGKLWAQKLMNRELPGLTFSPLSFTPVDMPGKAMNPKYESQVCQGVELWVTDRNSFQAVNTAVVMLETLRELYPSKFEVRANWLDKLWGSDELSRYLTSPDSVMRPEWKTADRKFQRECKSFWLYTNTSQ